MANKKSTAKSKPKQKTKSKSKKQAQKQKNHKVQISSIILFGVSLLLMALVFVKGQNVWRFLHNTVFGLFGYTAYIVPFLLLIIAIKVSHNENENSLKAKLIQLFLFTCVISGFVQTAFIGNFKGENYFDSMLNLYSNGITLKSSGFISGIIGLPIMYACGRVGAIILYIILTVVIIMLFSGFTVSDLCKLFSNPVKKVEEEYVRIRQEKEQYKQDLDDEAQEYVKEQENKVRPQNNNDFNVDVPIDFTSKKSKKQEKIDFAQIDKTIDEKFASENEKSPATEFIDKISKNEENAHKNGNTEQKDKQLDSLIEKALPIKTVPIILDEEMDTPTRVAQEKLNEEEKEQIKKEIDTQIEQKENKVIEYKFPPISLLKANMNKSNQDLSSELKNNAEVLVNTLKSFGVQTRIIDISRGPTVTRYELQPSAGVKISKITNLADDIALNLATAGVRIEAPIPNKAAVGIEVPNKKTDMVSIREVIDSKAFKDFDSKLAVALGRDISGNEVVFDIANMPHMLIAGATGSGKSVCINTLIMSILYKAKPDEVKLLMVDPKVVELGIYNGIPHLLVPVVTDPRKAAGALGWAVTEMLNRYKLFADNQVRDIKGYNELAKENEEINPMPQIVIIIDELADLMMASPNEVEDSICRLAQMARAAGMHLVIATQRPSVDVITGVIKANIPSRIAFSVSSQVDSRTIIDSAGAEKLLGRGDMLFAPNGKPKPIRVQCSYVSDKEVESVVKFVKEDSTSEYDDNIMNEIEKQATMQNQKGNNNSDSSSDEDELLPQAVDLVIEAGQASTSYLQRKLKVGYARAARIIDEMESKGIVGAFEGSKPRQVLISKNDWYEMKLNQEQAKKEE